VRGLYLKNVPEKQGSGLVGGFGGDGAGGGADEEPFRGAGDAAEGAAAACDLERVVALLGKRGGFDLFVGEIGLRGGIGAYFSTRESVPYSTILSRKTLSLRKDFFIPAFSISCRWPLLNKIKGGRLRPEVPFMNFTPLPKKSPLSVFVLSLFCSLGAFAAHPAALPQQVPSAAEMSKKETVASAFLRGLKYQEYEVRSAAEAMPEEKYGYRPAAGKFQNEKPEFGPAEVRTFAEQVKHVACANFAFAAELDGAKPPAACDKGGPDPAKTRKELLIYLRDSFAAIRKSLSAIDVKSMFDPIEGPYAGPNTRLGLATVILWHAADHYGQMTLYLRENGIVPPASRLNPPELQDK